MVRTGRPKKLREEGEKILVTLPVTTLEGLDEMRADLADRPGGSAITRQDVIRDLLARDVAAFRAEKKGAKKK
jgi:hypothetical protein